MKNKKIVLGLVLLIYVLFISTKVNAISFNLDIKGEKTVEINKTIQLKAEYWVGNDMWIPEEPNGGIRELSRDDVTNDSLWSSSNNKIAVVDSNGKVTGISEGTATITAKYEFESNNFRDATYEVTVKINPEYTGIMFLYDEPGPGMILNHEDRFNIGLYNIPKTEKENIKFKIENENIAKITKTEYDKGWADAIATVKYLSIGKTKLIATLDYNGKTYSDSYDLDVIETNYNLVISSKENKELPTSINIGDKMQLMAILDFKRGSLLSLDVTSDDNTIWTSSDERIVKIDNNGLLTAINEGTATITAKYNIDGQTVMATYDLKVIDPTKSPINPGTTTDPNSTEEPTIKFDGPTELPKTGKNLTIVLMGIIIVTILSLIIYKKYNNYKDIK